MGGRTSSQQLRRRQTTELYGLLDLGYKGYQFTWSNRRQNYDNIQSRLDHTLATTSFIHRFDPVKVKHLSWYGPDYDAIGIVLEVNAEEPVKKRKHTS